MLDKLSQGLARCGISEAEAKDAALNLAGFMETLIEIDKSLKKKGNENANIGSSNIVY